MYYTHQWCLFCGVVFTCVLSPLTLKIVMSQAEHDTWLGEKALGEFDSKQRNRYDMDGCNCMGHLIR